MFGELVRNLLSTCLRTFGVFNVAIDRDLYRRLKPKQSAFEGGLLHALANEIVRGEASVCREYVRGYPLTLSYGVVVGIESERGSAEFDHCIRRRCAKHEVKGVSEALREFVLELPIFVLDFSLYELHTETECKLLLPQLMSAISQVKRRLTELNIVLANVPTKLVSVIKELTAFKGLILNEIESARMYGNFSDRMLLLDPYASEVLDESDCMKYQVFVLGMIIDDKIPRPYATSVMARILGVNLPRKKIVLWGSRVGVPNRVNKVIDIVLDIRAGKRLEEAIIRNMSTYDKLHRLRYEVERLVRTRGALSQDDVVSIARRLGLDHWKALRVLQRYTGSGGRT